MTYEEIAARVGVRLCPGGDAFERGEAWFTMRSTHVRRNVGARRLCALRGYLAATTRSFVRSDG